MDCGQYKDITYRSLKGLRKTNPTHDPNNRDSSLEVPSKCNTVVFPKYPELFRVRPLHKKIREYEILLLEYEEEEEEEGDINDETTDTATAIAAAHPPCDADDDDNDDDDDDDELHNENGRKNGDGDAAAAMVHEEKECNYEGDAEWRHAREDKKDDEDGNDARDADVEMEKELSKQSDDTNTQEREEKNDDEDGKCAREADGDMEKERSKHTDDTDCQEREEKNDDEDGNNALDADGEVEKEGSKQTHDKDTKKREEKNDKDGRGDVSVARRKGCKKDDDRKVDIPVAQQRDEEKDDHDKVHISTTHDGLKNKQNLEGNDDTAVYGDGTKKDNDNGCDSSAAPPAVKITHISDTEAGHTNDDNNGNFVAFEDRIKEVKRNALNKINDSDTNKRMPQNDEGDGSGVSFEPVTEKVKSQQKEFQNGVDFNGLVDDDYDAAAAAAAADDDDDDADNEDGCDFDSVLSQSETQIAEHGDCCDDILTDDTLSQYLDIQTDTDRSIESDGDIENGDGPTTSCHTNEDINGQTKKRTYMDDQEEDDSVSGILGIYAIGQYDLEFSFYK